MEMSRRSRLIYVLLGLVWVLVVVWQADEHRHVDERGKTDLRRNSKAIVNTLGAVIRGQQFRGRGPGRGPVFRERLEPILNELLAGYTNEPVKSAELISIALLNAAGDQVVSAGRPINLEQKDLLQEGEHWGARSMTVVYSVEGVPSQEGTTNAEAPLILDQPTNSMRGRGFPRRDARPNDSGTNAASTNAMTASRPPDDRPTSPAQGRNDRSEPPRDEPSRRPFWARGMSDEQYQELIAQRELHGMVLTLSTEAFQSILLHDLWLRCVVCFFAGISAVGVGLAWRNLSKTAELQIRLVRASELNTHLREMNLAAAGLAHETRNPLNIIRGMAQLIAKLPETLPEVREKSRAIVAETDKVTAQLNEFINYSRPREIRRAVLPLVSAIQEVGRALDYDLEEKKVTLEVKGEAVSVEADEQLFRQALFNLLLNAVQAVDPGGEIKVFARRDNDSEASIEIRDNGPGVPPERRREIFKPYFTMQQKGTGLGLAVVQQIVLAHGWEIECLANEPKGALFRITHLKIT
jgi:signal transduction histidine kinase